MPCSKILRNSNSTSLYIIDSSFTSIERPSNSSGLVCHPPPSSCFTNTPEPPQVQVHRPLISLGPPRIPETRSLDDALRYWEEGDEGKGLIVPLNRWCIGYQPSAYRSQAQKLSMIGIVCDEFNGHCKGDWELFEQTYPGLRYKYTKLVKAVRDARIMRGETKQRHRRRYRG
jgi:hypothetical protein